MLNFYSLSIGLNHITFLWENKMENLIPTKLFKALKSFSLVRWHIKNSLIGKIFQSHQKYK